MVKWVSTCGNYVLRFCGLFKCVACCVLAANNYISTCFDVGKMLVVATVMMMTMTTMIKFCTYHMKPGDRVAKHW